MKSYNYLEEDLLKIFDWLRFPLIIGVIFIHNQLFSMDTSLEEDPIGANIVTFLSNGICRLAVPIFFFMSGYLFFYKVKSLTKDIIINKFKRRFSTLLIPYLLWNLIVFLIFVFIDKFISTTNFFCNLSTTDALFKTFIGESSQSKDLFPLVYQMWFIRDLMLVVLISPLIYYLVSRLGYFFIIPLSIMWILGLKIPLTSFFSVSLTSIFYFSLGAYFSIHRISFLHLCKRLKYIALLYPILLTLNVLLIKSHKFHNLTIICGIIFVFYICGYLLERNCLKPIPFLTSASFFVFAIHDPILLSQLRILWMTHIPQNNITLLIGYFFTIGLTIGIALFIYYLFSKYTPKTISLLTGGRVK